MEDHKITPEKILRATGMIKDISYPSPNIMLYKGESIEKLFKEASQCLPKEIQNSANLAFPRYIASCIFLDVFEDIPDPGDRHAQRGAFEKVLLDNGYTKAYELYRSNGLKVTHLRNVLGTFPFIDKAITINDPFPQILISKIHPLISFNPDADREKFNPIAVGEKGLYSFDKYDIELSLDKKLEVVELVTEFARAVCIYLIEYYQNSSKS